MIDDALRLFYQTIGNWQMIALAFVMLFLLFRKLNPEYFERMMKMFPWKAKWVLIGVLFVFLIQAREVYGFPLVWIAEKFPSYTLFEQLFFYMGSIHIRSILFFSIMIFWLWRKMDAVVPALMAGFFWIGLVELSFIPQHWIWLQYFMGWNHYFPFILIMVPFLLERKRFRVPRMAWIWFIAGMVIQYGCIFFADWSIMILDSRGFGFYVNPLALPHPHLGCYLWDIGQHVMKTFFTVAGCYTAMRIEHSSISLKKERGDNGSSGG